MIIKKSGIVDQVIAERIGAQEIDVLADNEHRYAINYPALTGIVKVGDRVILNTTATALNLGTGGFDFVIHIDRQDVPTRTNGHLMKLRYTPLQFGMQAGEEKYADLMPESLDGTPVIACCLHSQIASVAFAVRSIRPNANITYVMTDTASLPLGFSKLVPALKEAGMLSGVITCGQAFGGDIEAVNVYSALLLAKCALKADVIIVSQGPGNVGTGTPWGFSAVDQGQTLNATASLEGKPICCLRIGFADKRLRHVGISHHSITVLKQIALSRCLIPLPSLPKEQMQSILTEIKDSCLTETHDIRVVDTDGVFEELIMSGLPLSTMGRTPKDDPAFFKACLAAGLVLE
jgi:hypothetical protein